jgi:hypothetical protein
MTVVRTVKNVVTVRPQERAGARGVRVAIGGPPGPPGTLAPHAATHGFGGSDPVTIAQSQVVGLTQELDDVITITETQIAEIELAVAYKVDESDLGTAAYLDAGTTEGDILQLLAGGKLPAVDGSNLTNLPGGGSGISVGIAAGLAIALG